MDSGNPDKMEYIDRIEKSEEGIISASNVLAGLNVDYSMWSAQERHNNAIRDREMLKREIIRQRETSLQEGIQRGAHGARIETARGMLSYGMPKDKVAEIAGLPLAEVQQLQIGMEADL